MAKRTDNNQADIVQGLRDCYVFVIDTHSLGRGFPDLVAWSPAAGWRLLEVKSPRGKLTRAERKLHAECPGPIDIVRTVDEALSVMGLEVER